MVARMDLSRFPQRLSARTLESERCVEEMIALIANETQQRKMDFFGAENIERLSARIYFETDILLHLKPLTRPADRNILSCQLARLHVLLQTLVIAAQVDFHEAIISGSKPDGSIANMFPRVFGVSGLLK